MTATKRKPKPITANPMFPFVTALWFATFLGLGSFAVAPALLEGPVVALGIPAIIPAAAPPLGFTARVMLALLMLGVGAVAGFLVGRWLGREKVATPARTRAFSKAAQDSAFVVPRPINPSEDLDEPLDAPVAEEQPLRRRALSLTEEPLLAMPSEAAPLPGNLPWESYAQTERPPVVSGKPPLAAQFADPLGLESFFEDAQDSALRQEFVSNDVVEPLQEAPADPAPSAVEPQIQPVLSSPSLLQAHAAAATPLESAPLDNLGLVQLIERLALAISRRANGAQATTALGAMNAMEPAESIVATQQPATARFESALYAEDAVSPLSVKPARFADPERVVQLRPAAMPPASPVEGDFDGACADEVEDLGLGRFLRLSAESPATDSDQLHPADASNEPASVPEVAEDRYPSLLDIGPVAARREALRIDDGLAVDHEGEAEIEPVVVFPGQQPPLGAPSARPFEKPAIMPLAGSPLAAPGRAAPSARVPDAEAIAPDMATGPTPDAEEADRALRAALATLQRMTAQG